MKSLHRLIRLGGNKPQQKVRGNDAEWSSGQLASPISWRSVVRVHPHATSRVGFTR